MRLDIPKIVPHLMKRLEDHKSGSIAHMSFDMHPSWHVLFRIVTIMYELHIASCMICVNTALFW